MEKQLYRVRFYDQSEKKTIELIVESVESSEFMGLVSLKGLVFSDNKKLVILPEEDAVRSRFGKTDRLHVPYHSIIFIEEFVDEPANVKQLPFIREVKGEAELKTAKNEP